jgi:PAS domain S-box-containing protein
MNPVAEMLTGWDRHQARGRALPEVFPIINEETRIPVDNPVDRVLREGARVALANHTVLVRRDGTDIPIDDTAARITDGAGSLCGVVLVFRDVTDEKRAVAAENTLPGPQKR